MISQRLRATISFRTPAVCVVQIGELVVQLSDEVKRQNPAIPWRVIKDTRTSYVHAYGAIDIPSVWDTLNHDIPALKSACETILQVCLKPCLRLELEQEGNNGADSN